MFFIFLSVFRLHTGAVPTWDEISGGKTGDYIEISKWSHPGSQPSVGCVGGNEDKTWVRGWCSATVIYTGRFVYYFSVLTIVLFLSSRTLLPSTIISAKRTFESPFLSPRNFPNSFETQKFFWVKIARRTSS